MLRSIPVGLKIYRRSSLHRPNLWHIDFIMEIPSLHTLQYFESCNVTNTPKHHIIKCLGIHNDLTYMYVPTFHINCYFNVA